MHGRQGGRGGRAAAATHLPRSRHSPCTAGAKARRQRGVLSLLRAARESEARYLVRTLVRNLRVGSSWRSVVPALARSITLHKEGAQAPKVGCCRWGQAGRNSIPRACAVAHPGALASLLPSQARLDAAAAAAAAAFHVCPDLQRLVAAMVAHPVEEWRERCPMTPGAHGHTHTAPAAPPLPSRAPLLPVDQAAC